MQQWNEIFKNEEKVFTKIHEDMPKILKLFKKRNVKRILDLGCGSGRHLVYFAKRGFDVYGIDISEEGLEIAKSWLKKENLKANLKIGSVYHEFPYPDDFFDALICVQVLQHAKISRIHKSIKEIERILKFGGILFLIVPKSKYRLNGIKFKTLAPRTYVPLDGREKGLTHYIYNKKLLRKDFSNFKIKDLWLDSHNHYCLLGELKK